MSLIRLHDISKVYDDQTILREIFFRLNPGDRVGLIGRNGSGKTTIFKMILGREEPSSGSISVNLGVQVGYFSQFSELDGEQSILDVLGTLFSDIQAIEAQLEQVDAALNADPPHDELDGLLLRQAELFEQMDAREGWTCGARIDTALTRLGFSDAHRNCPIDQLSGGWRNRAALAQILLQDPDVLLMDEPTNFLDIEGLSWLEEWFQRRRGALMMVSHDRHFMDRVVTSVVEIENHRFQTYEGNFSQYVREKSARMKTLERQFEHEEELLAYEAEAIARRSRAAGQGKDKVGRSRGGGKKHSGPRLVDKIVRGLYGALYVPNKLCEVTAITKAYDGQALVQDLSFELLHRQRIAILGPNGCGKSTLLRVLLGEEGVDGGEIVWAKGVETVSFNQMFAGLDGNESVIQAVSRAPSASAGSVSRKQANLFLSLLQFSEAEQRQRVATLSGGQQARVALAQCLVSGAGVIVLDEPTNHLDLASTQVMERALVQFPGAVIVASHDRFFIDKVATRLLVFVGPGQVRPLAGNWSTLEARRAQAARARQP